MKLLDYLQTTELQSKYIDTGLIDYATHDDFPLAMLTYGREAVYTNTWDSVICKCRGLIYNTETMEIIARPFEKFWNLGTAGMPETDPDSQLFAMINETADPEVWEKMDGFLATLYNYNGKSYIASKGSFHSTHAKWATAWYNANVIGEWPAGYTPVFEGICSSLRIVVGYEFEGLVLLALINKETGEELNQTSLRIWAAKNGVKTPYVFLGTWQQAREQSMNPETKNVEGYVLVWRRPGQTPFRLKVKYVDYLRLHRMVSGVSAKAIYNCLAGNEYKGDLDEWTQDSLPWFSKFVNKWVRALTLRHDELEAKAKSAIKSINDKLKFEGALTCETYAQARKAFALEFQKPEYGDVKPILFALLDGHGREQEIIWKLVKPMTKAAGPMLDVSKM